SAVDGNNIWAVGDSNVLFYDGTSWRSAGTSEGGRAISARDANDAWMAGVTKIHRWNGSNLTKDDIPGPAPHMVNCNATVDANNAWAVGFPGTASNRRPLIVRWSCPGGVCGWSQVSSPDLGADSFLNSVDKYDGNHIWAVGSYYDQVAARYNTLTE